MIGYDDDTAMTLDQLRIFVAVAEVEHVTRAAEALNLTQSAVSGAIAALEQRHQVRLFDRVGRRIELNQAGRALLLEARAILSRVAAAEATLAALSGLKTGRLSIHASQTIASYWLPPRLIGFHQLHPGVALDVQVGNTREVAEAVGSGAAEIGFVEGEVEDAALEQTVVGSDRLLLVVRPHHPWAWAERLTAEDLMEENWVLREQGSGTRSSFEAAIAAAGLDPGKLKVALSLPSNEAVMTAVASGAGATVLSQSVVAAALARGVLLRAPFDLPERPYRIVRHRERHRSPAAEAFTAFARELTEREPVETYAI